MHIQSIALILTAVLANTTGLYAQSSDSILTNKKGQALKGFDPVAYLKDSAAVKGDTAYAYPWAGVTWLFKNEEHQELFMNNPDQYAPRYGGYCAYGVRWWRKVITDPHQFSIYKGELYLNLNERINERWRRHPEMYIRKADKRWHRAKNKKAE